VTGAGARRPRTGFGPGGAYLGFWEPLTPPLARPGDPTVAAGRRSGA
jgi:hypothetical protein